MAPLEPGTKTDTRDRRSRARSAKSEDAEMIVTGEQHEHEYELVCTCTVIYVMRTDRKHKQPNRETHLCAARSHALLCFCWRLLPRCDRYNMLEVWRGHYLIGFIFPVPERMSVER